MTRFSSCRFFQFFLFCGAIFIPFAQGAWAAKPFQCTQDQYNALGALASTYCSAVGTINITAIGPIHHLELCINYSAQNDCNIDRSKSNCDISFVGADLYNGLTQGPSGQVGALAKAMNYGCSQPGTLAIPSCYFQQKDHSIKLRSLHDAETALGVALVRYESAIQTREKALLKVIDKISFYDGKITELLLDMGIEGITAFTNKLTCDDAAYATICNKNRGQFNRIKSRYAHYLGAKRGEVSKLASVDKLYGVKVKRYYNRARLLWIDEARKINDESQSQNRLDVCQGNTPAALMNCPTIPPADPSTDTPPPGCRAAPDNPPQMSKGGDGCWSLFGSLGEAIGATICTNRLINFYTEN